MRDFEARSAAVNLLEPQDLVATDTVSNILDTAGFQGACIGVQIGALTGVDGSNYLTPILQESDTVVGTDFTAVDSGDIHGAFSKVDSTSEDSVVQYVGYHGDKRYIRVKLDYTGAGITAGIVGVLGVLGIPGVAPATAPAAVSAT